VGGGRYGVFCRGRAEFEVRPVDEFIPARICTNIIGTYYHVTASVTLSQTPQFLLLAVAATLKSSPRLANDGGGQSRVITLCMQNAMLLWQIRPSVRPSVTLWYCIETNTHIIKLLPTSGTGLTLSWALNTRGGKIALFDRNRRLSWKQNAMT